MSTTPTFATGRGKVTTDFGGGDVAYSVALQSDGKILVAGYGGSSDFALARYNVDGSLDTTFGTNGKVTTDFNAIDGFRSNDSAYSVIVQSDGKILLAGTATQVLAKNSMVIKSEFALARYNADGSLDTTFDTDGKVTTAFFEENKSIGNSVAVQSDGKILVAGSAANNRSYDFALARYNADGSLDTTFDTDGKVTTSFGGEDGGRSVTVQSDGKILVAGYSDDGRANTNSGNFALARYNVDGSLDTTFGTNGKVTTDFGGPYSDSAYSITLQSDGKILVAGFGRSYDFALARYNVDGSLDTTFDTDGKVTTDFFGRDDRGMSVTVQSDGKILVTGAASTGSLNSDFALARYNVDGSLDTTFDTDGKVTTDFGGAKDNGNSVAVQSDGKILVAGVNQNFGGFPDFVLARYNVNGSLDGTSPLTVSSFSPLGGATGVGIASNIVVTFSEAITKGTGDIVLKNAAGVTFGIYDAATSSNLSISGKVLTINPTFNLSNNTGYKVEFAAGSIKDLAGNSYAGTTSYNFTTAAVSSDATPPTASSFSPLGGATGVAIASNIVVTFSEAVTKGTGSIVLKTTAGVTVATYDAATSSNLSVSGSTLTINPTADLSNNTGYKVEFAAGSIKDLAGNSYAGTTSYNFTTVAAFGGQKFTGTSSSDTFASGPGNDSIDGGTGIDTVVFSATRNAHILTKAPVGWTISSPADGTDSIVNIERLQFSDKKLALDLNATEHAGQALMFVGLMAPTLITSPGVVGTILGLFDQGNSLLDVCQLAIDVGLVSAIAGSNTNAALAAMAFRNVVGSEANADAIKMLVGYMDGSTASFTQSGFMAAIAGLELNQTHIGLVGLQQIGIEYA